MTNKWIKHYQAMVRGELPHKKFYLIPNAVSPQLGAGDINVVSPTQEAVEQVKMAVERIFRTYSPPGERKETQNT